MTLGKIFLSGFGGLTASFASMLCCTGPLVMASMGLSGAGLAVMRPYRPIFLVITGVFLWLAYRQMEKEDSCDSDKPCADPRKRRRLLLVRGGRGGCFDGRSDRLTVKCPTAGPPDPLSAARL